MNSTLPPPPHPTYTVGLVGLGKIAAGYSGPDDPESYTHAGGILHSERVNLAAAADVSSAARDGFRAKWGARFPGARYDAGLEAMLEAGVPDVVALCTPGPYHFDHLRLILEAKPKAVFLEKPPTCSLAEMDEVMSEAAAARVPVTVSFTRHWGPHVLRMAELVREGLIGEVTSVVGYCGGPFLSFASHTTDMICQFADYQPRAVYARGGTVARKVPEGYEPEPVLRCMVIEFENGVIGTQIGHAGAHGTFYCDVVGTRGRACVPFYGTPSAHNEKGDAIGPEDLGWPEPASPFQVAYDQIAAHLDGGPLPDCTNGDFVAVHETSFAGIESALTDRRITLPNRKRDRRIYANG
jgi:predicted dehydrogenase